MIEDLNDQFRIFVGALIEDIEFWNRADDFREVMARRINEALDLKRHEHPDVEFGETLWDLQVTKEGWFLMGARFHKSVRRYLER